MDAQKLTQKSLEAVKAAQSLAVEYNNMQIENLHLAYALLSDENGLIPQLVKRMGIEPQALRQAAKTEIENSRRSPAPAGNRIRSMSPGTATRC